MQQKELFKAAVLAVKAQFPALDPEAVICLLVLFGNEGKTVGKISEYVGMTEPETYRHLSVLQRSDIATLHNTGTGSNEVFLSEHGKQVREQIQQAVSAGGK